MSMAAIPFFDLPAELRIKIYGYLLSTKFTKIQLTYHKHGPGYSIPGFKTHHYHFHTAILSANRQVNSEAGDVFYRQNLFVSLTCGDPEFDEKIGGVVAVATGHHASNFKHYSMEVHLGPHRHRDDLSQYPYEQLIIAGEDVPHFCNILPGVYVERHRLWGGEEWTSTNVSVQINVERVADIEKESTGPNNDCPSVKRLLEPFCRLYGMRVRIGGYVTLSYKERIEQCAARQPPTAAELVSMVFRYREEGNDATQHGNLTTAAKKYETALDLLLSGYMRLTVHPATVASPEFPTKETLTEMNNLQVNLRSVLASSYLELGEYAKSYRCAQDVCFYEVKSIAVWQDCAHVMFCQALAGKALGQPVQALMDLDLGLQFDRYDEKMKKERKVLCDLVRKGMDSDLQMKWTCALNTRSNKSKKRQNSAAAQNVARWKFLEALIKGKYNIRHLISCPETLWAAFEAEEEEGS